MDRFKKAFGPTEGASVACISPKFTVEDGDLTAAAGNETISSGQDLVALHPGAVGISIEGFLPYLGEEFAGGSASAVTAQLGENGGDADGIMEATSVFTGVGVGYLDGALGGGGQQDGFFTSFTPACRIDATSDTVDNLTAGSFSYRVKYQVWYDIDAYEALVA